MNYQQFRDALADLNVSQHQFAREIEMDITTVNRWATGKAEIPGIAVAYVRLKLDVKALCRKTFSKEFA
jgi:DNA-binding transcriptional regulator YiaG